MTGLPSGNRPPKGGPREGELPYSPMTEHALLAAILLDEARVWPEVRPLLQPDDFWLYESQHVFTAMVRLHNTKRPITVPTVAWELSELGLMDELDRLTGGTETYLVSMAGDWALSAWGVGAWAHIIKDCADRRRIIERGSQMVQRGYAPKRGGGISL